MSHTESVTLIKEERILGAEFVQLVEDGYRFVVDLLAGVENLWRDVTGSVSRPGREASPHFALRVDEEFTVDMLADFGRKAEEVSSPI